MTSRASARTPETELAFGADAPLRSIMSTTRAMRRLRPDPVPQELLISLVEAALLAPSAANTQANGWVIVTERGRIQALAPLWRKVFDLYMATFARLSSPTMSDAQRDRLYAAVRHQVDHFSQIPALLVACYDMGTQWRALLSQWRGALTAARRLAPAELVHLASGLKRTGDLAEAASVYPGVQNLLLTARALGLGATMTTWHLLLEPDFKRTLEIPARTKTFAIVPVGWPRGNFGPVRRRPPEESVHWQRWNATR